MQFKSLTGLQVRIKKILWITISWVIISLLMFLSDYILFDFYNFYPPEFDLFAYFITFLASGILAGLIGGSVIVFIMEPWFRTRPYGIALLLVIGTYIIVCSVISYISGLILFSIQHDSHIFAPEVQYHIKEYFFSPLYIKGLATWLIITLGTIIVLMVNDKYGPGVFLDFLKGKYFQPRKEERIFMFLDLKSSTTIAEQLGEEKYFNFLKRVFSDITPSIIYSRGEIYQYVGDEIVISWKVGEGKQRADCLKCFYNVLDTLAREKKWYEDEFGVVPEFKAGLHYGHVIAGEIGVVKKDITFSGDVLNTAARIQSKCNEYGVNILLSKYLLDKLSIAPNSYLPKKIGELTLRGKASSVVLYTL